MTYRMNKSEAFQLVDAYLEGLLSELEKTQFEAILKTDSSLGKAVEEARVINRLLSEQEWVSPSVSFTEAVMSRIETDPSFEPVKAMDVPLELNPDLLLDKLLESQVWMTPSHSFTRNVMQRIELATEKETELAPVSRREAVIDWIQGLAPAAAIIAFVIMFGQSMYESIMGYLQQSATVIDAVVGTKIFESQPLIQLGVIVPLIGVCIISAMVTRRLRLAS